ncbi:DUF262 domain-containing protein [Herbaspirillum seropedicae]|uniref:DUF262 domain-containing protein n=1 Tax=Herbaspirillum seropedicae TaxID=964 RepID=UPI003FCDB1E4
MGKKLTSVDDVDDVDDETLEDTSVAVEQYAISSFGIDFDVEGLVRRLKKGDIYVPDFQRNFVWSHRESSQFVESLLLGLPVPGVFLAKDRHTQKLMIIDGQQRLRSLEYFYGGFFRPDASKKAQQVFELTQVQPQFQGRTYDQLSEDDQRRLDNSVIHATIIKQESPDENEDSSLFYVFGRLNSGGRKVTGQEIRTAIYGGPLMDMIDELNQNKTWRILFGKESVRLKDRELILRFLALYYSADQYERPMEEFLNRFARKNRAPSPQFLMKSSSIFLRTIELAHDVLGANVFRPVRSMNAAVFDSIAVALARRLDRGEITAPTKLKKAFEKLSVDGEYVAATSRSTANEESVSSRLLLATSAFAGVK